jgi:hypothetical protein
VGGVGRAVMWGGVWGVVGRGGVSGGLGGGRDGVEGVGSGPNNGTAMEMGLHRMRCTAASCKRS